MQTVQKNYPLCQSLFFIILVVDIVKFAVTFGLTSRMVTIRAQAHLMNETSRWQKREKLRRAIQCKKLYQRSCHEACNQPKYDLWLRTERYYCTGIYKRLCIHISKPYILWVIGLTILQLIYRPLTGNGYLF